MYEDGKPIAFAERPKDMLPALSLSHQTDPNKHQGRYQKGLFLNYLIPLLCYYRDRLHGYLYFIKNFSQQSGAIQFPPNTSFTASR